MSNEYLFQKQVRPVRRGFVKHAVVILAQETDGLRTGRFVRYCEDRRFAFVCYPGDTELRQVRVASLRFLDEWREERKQQATIKDYWTAQGGERANGEAPLPGGLA